jgi:hypothetical protein
VLVRVFFIVICGVVLIAGLTVLTARAVGAGSSGHPLLVKKPPILNTCPEIFDPELDTLRGRYAAYYFGLDVRLDLTGTGPFLTMTPHPQLPPGTVVTSTGISYQDPEVKYLAGLGPHSLYQAVRVTGDGKIVTGVVNLDIMVPQGMLTGNPLLSLPKGSLTGLTGQTH